MTTAVAVCNYNRRDKAVDCIRSVLAQDCGALRIFVVDNASTDGSAEAVEAIGDPRIRVCRRSVNEGSSGGFHRAVALAMECDPDHLAVLDSDCVMSTGALSSMVGFLRKHTDCAMVGPKVYRANPAGIVQELGAFLDWDRAVFRRNHGDVDESADGMLVDDEEVDYVPACCLVVTGEAVRRYGNMRPDWFLYFDDIEWATRMKRGGSRIVAVASAEAVHHGGGLNRTSHIVTYYYWRNRIHFFREFTPPASAPTAVQSLRRDIVRALATCTVLGAPRAAAAIGLAARDAVVGRRGQADFSGIDLSMDPRTELVPPSMEDAPRVRVEHVLDDAAGIDSGDHRLILEDSFGKRLPLEQALALLPEYRNQLKRFRSEFRVLSSH